MHGNNHQKIKTLVGAVTLAAFLSMSGIASALDPDALPTDGKITSGSGSISTSGSKMTVNQFTQKMIANWSTFNIGTRAGVTFRQPNSDATALNRIYDQNPSQILGSLSANGNIFLINPSGIVFGQSAQINVGGLVASSLNMLDSDFLAGKYTFANDGKAGSIINQGNISVIPGGIVALIGPTVTNEGTITATSGDVLMAAGNQVTLDFNGDGLISYTIDKGTINALADNKGLIKADGGLVVMTAKAADSLTQAVVNQSGVIEAQTLQNKGGRIMLMSDMANGQTIVGGTLDASAPNGGDGGFIETSGAKVNVDNDVKVTTYAPNGSYGLWLIDPQNYTVAASGGDIDGATLSSNLETTPIELQSSDGGTTGDGNVNINDEVSWSANTTLTLTASNDVNINADITATGDAAGLVINPNTANGSETPSGTGVFSLNNGAVITLSGLTPSLTIAGNPFTIINEANGGATALQNMNTNLSGYYALGSNIDTSATSGWNGGLGFAPIGNDTTAFTGQFNGLGHTISNLTINRPTESGIGLFANTGSGGTVSNVGLVGGSVTGYYNVGGLVGYNLGDIANSYTTGAVSGNKPVGGLVGENYGGNIDNSYATGTISGYDDVGGLVGYNDHGAISNSYATGDVNGSHFYVGGLIGGNYGGSINNTYATGLVSGNVIVGGLIGGGDGSITNSYATGAVSGAEYIGGLVGGGDGSITNSYATGAVHGSGNMTGGLVGTNWNGNIDNSYATGAVTGSHGVGGLVGYNSGGSIDNSYATGTVQGTQAVGGLVGVNSNWTDTYPESPTYGQILSYGSITNTYATGAVSGTDMVGGLVGSNQTSITNSYATGLVNNGLAETNVGGLVGYVYGGSATNSFWDTITTGQDTSAGGLGMTTAEMMTQSNFETGSGFITGTGWDFTNTWWLSNGNTRPFLQMEYSTNIVNSHQLQLMAMNLGTNYTLSADIDMSELTNPSGMWGTESSTILTGVTTGFSPIGNSGTPFTGTFDGLNRAITNLYINRPAQDSIGLFGYTGIGSTIRNVGMVGGSVTGQSYVGGLVGSNYGTITNAYSSGSVSGSYDSVGGLVGWNGGTVSSAYATGSVSGRDYVGGLIGYSYPCTISNTYSTGSVSGRFDVGGLIGHSYLGTVINTYATGLVTGSNRVGGLVGWNEGSVSNSYWDTTTSGTTMGVGVGFSSGVTGKTTAEMMDSANFSGWDFSNDWFLISGNTRPFLRSEYNTNIVNAHHLQLMVMDLGAHYTLGADIDMSELANPSGMWGTQSATILTGITTGFSSIGSESTPFTGQFDGMNHIISNLYINRPTQEYVGLFGYTGTGSAMSNVGLVGGSVTGNYSVGGLVGENYGTITNVYATGDVIGRYYAHIGGLVGYNSGTITNAYATGDVISSSYYVGGLVGCNEHGTITNSYATGTVTGDTYIGGLVGGNYDGMITNAYAIGTVSGMNDYVGGLVGKNGPSGTITNVYATGDVIGNGSQTGGLIGYNDASSTIINAYATGDVTGNEYHTGGLIGLNYSSTVSNTYATGAVSGYFLVGGLVGFNGTGGTVSNSYATGDVSGYGNVGGLVGSNEGTVEKAYATGHVTGTSYVGGLVGYNIGTVSNSYWDTITSGATTGIGGGDDSGATGLTTAQMMTMASFSGWDIANTGGTNAVWRIYEGNTYPLLRRFLNPLTITADNIFKTYDASIHTDTLSNVSYSDPDAPASGNLLGTNGYTNARNVSTYMPGYYSNQQGYDISYAGGTLTITPAPLTVTAQTNTKTYDATTGALAEPVVTGLQGSDTVTDLTEAYTDKNVGPGKTLSVSSYMVNDGNSGNNYTVTTVNDTTGVIGKADLTVYGLSTSDKVYDATTAATLGGSAAITPLLGDDVTLGGTAVGTFTDKNVGTDKTVTVIGNTISGADAGNYSLIQQAGLTADISPAVLTITARSNSKIYDGTTTASVEPIVTSGTVYGTDTANFIETYDGKNIGIGKTLTVSGIVEDGNYGNNYTYTFITNTNGMINKAPLIVAANSYTKTYDGLAYSGSEGVTYSGFVNSEASAVLGGSLSYSGTSQGATDIGNYVITPSGLVSGNYTIFFMDGNLIIDPAPLTEISGSQSVGGLVGVNLTDTITNSYATGTVGAGNNIGGLVGQNNGTITNSHTTDTVIVGHTVGGLVVNNTSAGSIGNFYATGVNNSGIYVITPLGLVSDNDTRSLIDGEQTITDEE